MEEAILGERARPGDQQRPPSRAHLQPEDPSEETRRVECGGQMEGKRSVDSVLTLGIRSSRRRTICISDKTNNWTG